MHIIYDVSVIMDLLKWISFLWILMDIIANSFVNYNINIIYTTRRESLQLQKFHDAFCGGESSWKSLRLPY